MHLLDWDLKTEEMLLTSMFHSKTTSSVCVCVCVCVLTLNTPVGTFSLFFYSCGCLYEPGTYTIVISVKKAFK